MTRSHHIDRLTVRSALMLAAAAPSVHNSQPWRWVVGPRSVHLYADLSRRLPATDPQGRDMIVSCGAALHHWAPTGAPIPPTPRRPIDETIERLPV